MKSLAVLFVTAINFVIEMIGECNYFNATITRNRVVILKSASSIRGVIRVNVLISQLHCSLERLCFRCL